MMTILIKRKKTNGIWYQKNFFWENNTPPLISKTRTIRANL